MVITISVVLILAGISISAIINNGGIIGKAKYAKELNRYEKVESEKELWKMGNEMKRDKKEIVSREDLLKDLGPDNKNLLTEEEKEKIRETGKIIIADKEIKFWNVIKSLNFTNENVTLIKGGEGTLKLDVDGLNESDLLWECDNNDVITLNKGKIISKDDGKANITCTLIDDTNITAKCTVTVVDGSDVYAEGTGAINFAPLKFYNIPNDCEALICYYYRGVTSEAGHISHMDGLRKAEKIRIKNQGEIDTRFYCDWYYKLEDSFGNTTDYYWFYGDFACFIEETEISTPDGLKNIEDIRIGDKVCTLNMETKQIEVKKVIQTFKHILNTKICKIYIGTECIECTTDHTIYEKNRGWIKAIELKEGDILVSEDGENKKINRIEIIEDDNFINVYNFEVEDNHNYFVGNNKILVHNPPEPSACSNEGIKYKGESIGK